jgi:hypothetical protein
MERGLLWLPLLGLFIGLAWAGWNEYQKVEAYRRWAEQFERAKYDIYAVLGQKADQLTWGQPTRQQPINVQTVSLKDVRSLELQVDQQAVSWEQPPTGSNVAIVLHLPDQTCRIPFTDVNLAAEWVKRLETLRQDVGSSAP